MNAKFFFSDNKYVIHLYFSFFFSSEKKKRVVRRQRSLLERADQIKKQSLNIKD